MASPFFLVYPGNRGELFPPSHVVLPFFAGFPFLKRKKARPSSRLRSGADRLHGGAKIRLCPASYSSFFFFPRKARTRRALSLSRLNPPYNATLSARDPLLPFPLFPILTGYDGAIKPAFDCDSSRKKDGKIGLQVLFSSHERDRNKPGSLLFFRTYD